MGQGNIVSMFTVLIVVMLFYSFSITLISYAIPDSAKVYITDFSNSNTTNFEGISTELESGLTKQTNIPVIDIGALVFYSGNLLIDLLLNFAYALPQMAGYLIHGIELLLNLDTYIFVYVESFMAVLMTALYFIGLIQLLAGIRSGNII